MRSSNYVAANMIVKKTSQDLVTVRMIVMLVSHTQGTNKTGSICVM